MRTRKNLCYIVTMVAVALGLAACEAYEEQKIQAQPGQTVVVDKNTTLRLDRGAEDTKSAMLHGYSWLTGEGVFINSTSTDGGAPVKEETSVGGRSRSDGFVRFDTIQCGAEFINPIFSLAGDPVITSEEGDSIRNKVVKIYNVSDGQELTTEDAYAFLFVNSELPTPNYQPTSSVTGVRYENGTDENSRIVWVEITVRQDVVGTTAGTGLTQTYEIGYVQVKQAAVEPEDPFEVRLHNFDLFRTYRKKTQHSICEGFMSFAVYNSRTGELVEEISTDGFSSQLAKTGHFGAPTNGYIVREATLLGTAPTSVTETKLTDNEEALSASYVKGNFKLTVTCYAQDYYVHFPVRGRDDAEGGMAAGGQNLFFTATCVYTNPETGWTKTWEFTHTTEVNVKGWETRTPQVDRSGETVNDVDGVRNLKYAGTYVVEFINHLYLNGEEVVQEDGNDDYYFQTSKVNGTSKPFHTSEMAIDCWTSYLP